MTHEAIQVLTACLNIAAGFISVTAMVVSTRANRKCQKALKDIEAMGKSQADGPHPSIKTH
jgi:hypothetical protein